MVEEIITAYHQHRIEASEYLKRANELMSSVINRTGDEIPERLEEHAVAKAYYGAIRENLKDDGFEEDVTVALAIDAALGIDQVIDEMRIVGWTTNVDRQNEMRTRIDDLLFDLIDTHAMSLNLDTVDRILDDCIEIAKVRYRD